MFYYAQRKSVKKIDGVSTPQTPINKYGDHDEMEYQFHLFCASAVKNDGGFEMDALEWGTIEQGVIERKRYTHEIPEPEPEPETPEEPENPETPENPE